MFRAKRSKHSFCTLRSLFFHFLNGSMNLRYFPLYPHIHDVRIENIIRFLDSTQRRSRGISKHCYSQLSPRRLDAHPRAMKFAHKARIRIANHRKEIRLNVGILTRMKGGEIFGRDMPRRRLISPVQIRGRAAQTLHSLVVAHSSIYARSGGGELQRRTPRFGDVHELQFSSLPCTFLFLVSPRMCP